MRATRACPLPQKRLEVPYVGSHEHPAFCNGQLQDLGVREPFEFGFGIQSPRVATATMPPVSLHEGSSKGKETFSS